MFERVSRQPLYLVVASQLRSDIQSKRSAGDLLPSEKELAKQFGVSIATVREALSTLIRDNMIERRQGVGTFVVESQRSTGNRVGVLCDVDLSLSLRSPFYQRLPHLLRKKLAGIGHIPVLYFGSHLPGNPENATTCPELLEDIRSGTLDGVICVSGVALHEWQGELEASGRPVVGVNGGNGIVVRADSQRFIQDAVAKLWADGCRRIAYLYGRSRPEIDGIEDASRNLFRQAVKRCGGEVDECWIAKANVPSGRGAGWEGFRQIWLSKECKPDGIIVSDDMLLNDVVSAIMELKLKVPDDLRIVNLRNERCWPPYPFPVYFYVLDLEMVADRLIEAYQRRAKNPTAEPATVLVPLSLEEYVPPGGQAVRIASAGDFNPIKS